MLVIVAIVLGALLGAYQAKRRGGNRLDIAQYAGVYAMIFGLISVIAVVVIERVF